MITYNTKQVARILDVKQNTVCHWIRIGKLNSTIESKKQGHRITREALEAFVEANPRYLTTYKAYQHIQKVNMAKAAVDVVLRKLRSVDLNKVNDILNQRVNEVVGKEA